MPLPEVEGGTENVSGDAATEKAAFLRVETLAGYGAAKDWALDLKTDLDLWRDGKLPWAEMSTQLLLSGPPGTGKTTFARALCNSLQVPLLVTSVSTWLEPSHLGDVIRRMRMAFEEARDKAPVILFIDEIDGIGKRQNSDREYADYWNSVVNRMLELVDGAVKTEGVIIVGATNRPARHRHGAAALRPAGTAYRDPAAGRIGTDRHHQAPSRRRPRRRDRDALQMSFRRRRWSEAKSQPKPETPPKPKPKPEDSRATLDAATSPKPPGSKTAKAREARATGTRAETVRQDGKPLPDPDVVLRPLAVKALGRSGADIERLVRQVRQTARREQRSITWPDLDAALGAGRPRRSAEHKRQIAVHEAGHAVVRHVLGEGDVEYLSIDRAFGGLTIARLREDIDSEERLGRLLAINLAGRAAEETVCGLVSAGSGGTADSDLAKATAMALAMETKAGLRGRPAAPPSRPRRAGDGARLAAGPCRPGRCQAGGGLCRSATAHRRAPRSARTPGRCPRGGRHARRGCDRATA